MHQQSTHTPRGWTLIECLIALAVAGILLGFGVSSANAGLQASHSFEARSNLLSSLTRARMAAALRERDVRLCPSADGETCLDGYHWEQGWLVFVDLNDNNRKDASDAVLQRQAALAPGVQLITSSGRRSLEFQPSAGNGGSNATFTICDGRGPSRAKAFTMNNAGGLREVPTTASAVAEACAQR